MNIITNNQPRHIIESHELTDEEKAQFDYIDWATEYSNSFVRYKGHLYHIDDEFTPAHTLDSFKDWDAYLSDTFFSGVLLRYVPGTDLEEVIMGRFYT